MLAGGVIPTTAVNGGSFRLHFLDFARNTLSSLVSVARDSSPSKKCLIELVRFAAGVFLGQFHDVKLCWESHDDVYRRPCISRPWVGPEVQAFVKLNAVQDKLPSHESFVVTGSPNPTSY